MSTTQKLWAGIAIAVISLVVAPPAWAANSSPATSAASATSAKPAVAPKGNGQMPADLQNALQMPQGPERVKALLAAAMSWEKSDPKAACEWVLSLPYGNDKAPFKNMLMDWGARDGATAAPWVLDHPKTLGFPGAVHFIVCAWGGTDPQAATAWSEKLPKGDLRKNAFNSVAEGYVRKDSPAAAVWMTKLTDDDDRHAAVRCVADFWSATAMAKSQEAITSWAEKLPPADLKIAAGWIVTNWSKKEPAKAKAWVEKLSLPEADKAEVLKKIK